MGCILTVFLQNLIEFWQDSERILSKFWICYIWTSGKSDRHYNIKNKLYSFDFFFYFFTFVAFYVIVPTRSCMSQKQSNASIWKYPQVFFSQTCAATLERPKTSLNARVAAGTVEALSRCAHDSHECQFGRVLTRKHSKLPDDRRLLTVDGRQNQHVRQKAN